MSAPTPTALTPTGATRVPSSPQRGLTGFERSRARQLVVTRRRATGILVIAAVVFVASTLLESRAHWLVWVQATAVASLVGGLADWFAVVALFRRPFGLPIPHTAIVVERKDRFAETLGSFVQENFLSPDAVTERLRSADAVQRAAVWMADPNHAADLAARAAGALAAGADLLRDEDVQATLTGLFRQRIDEIALAPLAGRALAQLTRDGRHDPVVESGLASLSRYLSLHGVDLHRRLGVRSPWWLPEPVENRLVDRLLRQTEAVLDDMVAHRDHPLRQYLDEGLTKLAGDLQTSPSLRQRGEELKAELLTQPQVRTFAAAVWTDTKEALGAQAREEDSALRLRLAELVAQVGQRLQADTELAAAAERGLDSAARLVLTRFESELVALVSGTISRWDAVETSRRLELLLGPDLQYIRINGTVIGALAGLALHAISVATGH